MAYKIRLSQKGKKPFYRGNFKTRASAEKMLFKHKEFMKSAKEQYPVLKKRGYRASIVKK